MLASDLPKYSLSIELLNDKNETPPNSSTAAIVAQAVVPYQENHSRKIFHTLFALINGALYFYVASAGVENIKKLFSITDDNATHELLGMGVGASLCYGMFSYKLIENLTLLPSSPLSKLLTMLAPFAASSFFTAGVQGNKTISENWYETPDEVGMGIGLALFMLRTLYMVDGSVKFPNKIQELKTSFSEALQLHDKKEMARLFISLCASFGFSLASTDAVYATMEKMLSLLNINKGNAGLTISSYIAATCGAIGVFPSTFYWTLRGVRQATYGGKFNENGATADPTDRHTFTGAIGTLPVALGVIGSVTAADGKVFGRLNTTATVVRASSSLIVAITGGIPGLSTLSRNITKKFSFFCNKSNSSSSADNSDNNYVTLNEDEDVDDVSEKNNSWCCWRKRR